MSTPVTLDSFLTTLTCLSSVTSNRPTILLNSKNEFRVDNAIGCPPQTVYLLTSQVRELIDRDTAFQAQINEKEKQVNEFKAKISKLQSKVSSTVTGCSGQASGFVPITIPDMEANRIVQCQHGWLVVAQRMRGDFDFMLNWEDYQHGFGELSRDFFIGLNALHALTLAQTQELLVYMEKQNGERAYAHYDHFSIGHESEKYALKILGKYNGTAGDALRHHAGQKFTTRDMDNDIYRPSNCALVHEGAWWYTECMQSNLFGKYQKPGEAEIQDYKGILWKGFLNGPNGSLKIVKMLIRPKLGDLSEF